MDVEVGIRSDGGVETKSRMNSEWTEGKAGIERRGWVDGQVGLDVYVGREALRRLVPLGLRLGLRLGTRDGCSEYRCCR